MYVTPLLGYDQLTRLMAEAALQPESPPARTSPAGTSGRVIQARCRQWLPPRSPSSVGQVQGLGQLLVPAVQDQQEDGQVEEQRDAGLHGAKCVEPERKVQPQACGGPEGRPGSFRSRQLGPVIEHLNVLLCA